MAELAATLEAQVMALAKEQLTAFMSSFRGKFTHIEVEARLGAFLGPDKERFFPATPTLLTKATSQYTASMTLQQPQWDQLLAVARRAELGSTSAAEASAPAPLPPAIRTVDTNVGGIRVSKDPDSGLVTAVVKKTRLFVLDIAMPRGVPADIRLAVADESTFPLSRGDSLIQGDKQRGGMAFVRKKDRFRVAWGSGCNADFTSVQSGGGSGPEFEVEVEAIGPPTDGAALIAQGEQSILGALRLALALM